MVVETSPQPSLTDEKKVVAQLELPPHTDVESRLNELLKLQPQELAKKVVDLENELAQLRNETKNAPKNLDLDLLDDEDGSEPTKKIDTLSPEEWAAQQPASKTTSTESKNLNQTPEFVVQDSKKTEKPRTRFKEGAFQLGKRIRSLFRGSSTN